MKTSTGKLMIGVLEYEITYRWIVVNDGGDLIVVAWEPLPAGAPSESIPDLIMNKSVRNEHEAESLVNAELSRSLSALARSSIHILCVDCND